MGPSCHMASAKKTLSRVQRLSCLGITGVIHTTLTGAMEALTGLPPLDLAIQGEASQRHIVSGVWDVGLTFTPSWDIVVYCCGFRGLTKYLMWELMLWDQILTLNPNIGWLCWLEKSGPEDQGLLQKLKGLSGSHMNPGWKGLGLGSRGNLREEGSVRCSFAVRDICYLGLCSL